MHLFDPAVTLIRTSRRGIQPSAVSYIPKNISSMDAEHWPKMPSNVILSIIQIMPGWLYGEYDTPLSTSWFDFVHCHIRTVQLFSFDRACR